MTELSLNKIAFSRIKILADKRRISLQTLASAIGLSENYVYNLQSRKSSSSEAITKIADYFNVSTDYIYGRTDNPRIASENDMSEIDLKKDAAESFFYDGHELNEEDLDLIASILETRIKNRK
ncbi:helix-turn-helix domain-containing protein [Streptococcus suis]|uniref:helix-turn-helix domain-containing protein n=1 Tax=Streptococcus suis TaxID=1307 RepID=UPI0024100CE9|nr:helix-turn-helix domain-containing protein [Streptococcus suis]MDG3164675.1 helix-turn-helix domain-containing protein [Streptococcus suis]MDG3168463.1 helix-turn-helix domain-containing protein [Streptococcus suis]MDG3272484.1 helix-turn-helix domain-containing protein [Streptococcus suis]